MKCTCSTPPAGASIAPHEPDCPQAITSSIMPLTPRQELLQQTWERLEAALKEAIARRTDEDPMALALAGRLSSRVPQGFGGSWAEEYLLDDEVILRVRFDQ